jgi:hypothetical protein
MEGAVRSGQRGGAEVVKALCEIWEPRIKYGVHQEKEPEIQHLR